MQVLVPQVDCLRLGPGAAGSSGLLLALQHGLAPLCLSDPVVGAGFPAHYFPCLPVAPRLHTTGCNHQQLNCQGLGHTMSAGVFGWALLNVAIVVLRGDTPGQPGLR